MKHCFYCGKGTEIGDMTIIALDRPYANLAVHKGECFNFIEQYGIVNYLLDNIDKLYKYIDSSGSKGIKRKE